MERRRGEYYIAQNCDERRFELKEAGFSLECLHIFATGCSYKMKVIVSVAAIFYRSFFPLNGLFIYFTFWCSPVQAYIPGDS